MRGSLISPITNNEQTKEHDMQGLYQGLYLQSWVYRLSTIYS
jgi:hypothetical protein